MIRLFLLSVISVSVLAACSHSKCRDGQSSAQAKLAASRTNPTAAEGGSSVEQSASQDRVKVYKPDGSLQCGQGKAVPLNEMEKDLKGIKTYSSINKNDGMMRIQVCGSPTGNCNIYEIDRKDLDKALKQGFKQWTAE